MFLKSFLKKRVKQLITDKMIKNSKIKTVGICFVLGYLKGLKNVQIEALSHFEIEGSYKRTIAKVL